MAAAAPGAWDFAIPHMTPASWDTTALQQTPGEQKGPADASAAAIASGGAHYSVANAAGPPSTQLQQVYTSLPFQDAAG
jgi:hypothetical protein